MKPEQFTSHSARDVVIPLRVLEKFNKGIVPVEMVPRVAGPCHLWQGSKNGGGYGQICFHTDGVRYVIFTHVLAMRLDMSNRYAYNRDEDVSLLPSNMQVNHYCDVKHCCSPEHLYLGEQEQNMNDWRVRGSRREQVRQQLRLEYENAAETLAARGGVAV